MIAAIELVITTLLTLLCFEAAFMTVLVPAKPHPVPQLLDHMHMLHVTKESCQRLDGDQSSNASDGKAEPLTYEPRGFYFREVQLLTSDCWL